MTSPYLITGPALISFSGGRTSGLMLKRIIDAHGGALPDDVHVCFSNTGKEREQTLRFVHECGTRWGVHIRWLEFIRRSGPAEGRFVEVGYNSASRAGEPFERLIADTSLMPNPRQRTCTEYLKVRTMFAFMESVGCGKPGQFVETIGLRADEKRRIDRMRTTARNEASQLAFPLSSDGVRKSDVLDFWAAQPFDLELGRGLGNCDHCPMLTLKDRVSRAQIDPPGTGWWAAIEQRRGHIFGRGLSFIEVLGLAASHPRLPMDDASDGECGHWCPSGQ